MLVLFLLCVCWWGSGDAAVAGVAGDVVRAAATGVLRGAGDVLQAAGAGVLGTLQGAGLASPDPVWPEDYAPRLKDNATFEYVVVGAGAAGAALAARLALRGARVLLLDAGGDPALLTRVPGASMGLLGSNMDWQYDTSSNNVSCLSSIGRRCRFSRGKCLGGSTSINYMLHVRGNRRDFDDWHVAGWTWEHMEPYFLRFEGLKVLDSLPASSRPYHNTSGMMKMEFFVDSQNSWHERIFKSFQTLEFPINSDCNGKSQIGVTKTVGYVYHGERMSTARGYLATGEVKKRLKVAKNSRCTGVIINDRVARGVTVLSGSSDRKLRLYATKEVILSAGTIGTPQILMLSGVGPAEHLKEMNIPVKVDLPVGDNMSDHALALVIIQVDRGLLGISPNVFTLSMKGVQGVQWLTSRDGILASNGLTDATVFVNTRCYDVDKRQLQSNGTECEVPTAQIIHAYVDRGLISSAKPIAQHALNLGNEVFNQVSDANLNYALIIVSPIILRPFSRGSVRLASADPADAPAIHPNYLHDKRDVDELLRVITIVEHQLETPAFKDHGASILKLKLSGCGEMDREAYWRCYVRHMTYSVFHAAGTARLGAVLARGLRVRGVRRLRVADLSAPPLLPRGNTAALALAVGERAADLLLDGDAPE